MARPERFELPTLGSEVRCSVQLSYGRELEKSRLFRQKRPAIEAVDAQFDAHSHEFCGSKADIGLRLRKPCAPRNRR